MMKLGRGNTWPLLLFLPVVAWAQPSPRERYEEFHRRLREQILRGSQDSEAWQREMDGLMDEMLRQGLGAIPHLRQGASPGAKLRWEEVQGGRRLEVTPGDPDAKLDVRVNDGQVSVLIEGRGRRTEQTQPVPRDCDGDKVKIEGKEGKLLLFFPYRSPT